jgi:hypothetical protein
MRDAGRLTGPSMLADDRFKTLAEAAAQLLALVDTSARYGQPISHAAKGEARRRLNAALHPDYHVDRYGGLRSGMPYVNDAEDEHA